ncbi:HlyD family efflux transporter periplasmic adaptor subunit [Stieleria sp. ICT_E10.1]|uniref:HlyD family secretion protein n=1 Tax=Stieleria sedimenti TaxID=2976331 RepID=UPI0021808F65|nr:HlyD family efflux transporter periplasmic adaptor subunit [Stieleria sedimenti]MCS7466177.1 HlyD family efflux transporter periplasmic adaptor subunit [Stieleria sedimenti]
MLTRFIPLTAAVGILLGLVFYSKWNPEPPRVSGFIEADEIRLGSRVGGRVSLVHVREGQNVAAGEVLVEFEPYDLLEREKELELSLAARESQYQQYLSGFREEEIAQAKAKLDQLQAQLDRLVAGPRKQEIEAARGRLALAESEKRLATQDFERLSKLAGSNATSQQELDAAREALEAASANSLVREQELELLLAGTREEELRAAAASVEEARQAWTLKQRGYRSEEIEQAKASRDAAQAALAAIGRQKEELRVRSPIDGTIEALDLQPGDMVAPGAPVLSMLDHHELWVRTYLPQNRIAVQVGRRLRLSVDSYPDQTFQGVVTFIARQAEFTPSNVQTPEERSKQVFRMKVGIDDQRDLLRPGMIVDVWLDEIGAKR